MRWTRGLAAEQGRSKRQEGEGGEEREGRSSTGQRLGESCEWSGGECIASSLRHLPPDAANRVQGPARCPCAARGAASA